MLKSQAEIQLKETLVQMHAREERVRKAALGYPHNWQADVTELSAVHKEVASEVSAILDQFGWPTFSMVDWEGAKALGESVSYCFTQPRFMRELLPMMEQSFRFGGTAGVWFGQLYDSIMILENKPQVFGTFLDWNSHGELDAIHLVAPDEVDLRRAALGLGPLQATLEQKRREIGSAPDGLKVGSWTKFRNAFAKKSGWPQSKTPFTQSLRKEALPVN